MSLPVRTRSTESAHLNLNASASTSAHTLDDDNDNLPSTPLMRTDDTSMDRTRTSSLSLNKTLAPFSMQDITARALARPRTFNHSQVRDTTDEDEAHQASDSWRSLTRPWADRDETSHCPDSPASSTGSSPWSSAPGSPITQPSSCALTPSSSSEGFTLGDKRLLHHAPPTRQFTSPRPAPSPPAASRVVRPIATSASVTTPSTVVQPRRAPSADDWTPVDFSLKLLFTQPSADPAPSTSSSTQSEDHSLPPAFFPSQRISFSPRLRITSPEGLPVAALGGMHLGVTGMLETLDEQSGEIKSKRVIADFCIDLTSGLGIWRKDAQAARQRAGRPPQLEGQETLPPGTYVLPLSMKIPNSDRLPPSFECKQYRIHYTMSIALYSSAVSSSGTPRRLKVFSLPFHVLPSTLPTAAPELPVLTHEHKKGMFASLVKTLSAVASPRSASASDNGYHIVFPSLPTSHFSPGAHSVVPVSLRIVDRPLEPTDLYIRLAIIRRTYVRESNSSSLASAIEDHWGFGAGISPSAMGFPEDVLNDPWCLEEREVVSRWGWVPYSSRPGADPTEKAEVVIRDIGLPLVLDDLVGWQHGYSNSLDLEPSEVPQQQTGECSWFSPAFRTRPPIAKEYARHSHVSTKFYLSLEIGFAPSSELGNVLENLGQLSPDLDLPQPNTFTTPLPGSGPFTTSRISGQSLTNPFRAHASADGSVPATACAFPGKLRELIIPITIGSVAEPTLACIVNPGNQGNNGNSSSAAAEREASARRAERAAREERGEATSREWGEGPDGAWLCAPPAYEDACKVAPYVLG